MKRSKRKLRRRAALFGLSVLAGLATVFSVGTLSAGAPLPPDLILFAEHAEGGTRRLSAAHRELLAHERLTLAAPMTAEALSEPAAVAALFVAESLSVNGPMESAEAVLHDPAGTYASALALRTELVRQRYDAFRLMFDTSYEIEAVQNVVDEDEGFARIWLRLRETSFWPGSELPMIAVQHYDVILLRLESRWKVLWATGEDSFSVLVEAEDAGIDDLFFGAYFTHANAALWHDYLPEREETAELVYRCQTFPYADSENVLAYEADNIRREKQSAPSQFYRDQGSALSCDRLPGIDNMSDRRGGTLSPLWDETVSSFLAQAGLRERRNELKALDRAAMFAYQQRFALGRNPDWPDFEPPSFSDCQNFASQVLFAGGAPFDLEGLYTWYFFDMEDRTPSWSDVLAEYDYLTWADDPGIAANQVTDTALLMPGDLVMLDTSGDGLLNHTVVVFFAGASPTVSAHSPDLFNRPLFAMAGEKVYFHLLGYDHDAVEREVPEQMPDAADALEEGRPER